MGSQNGSIGSAERQSQKDMAREIKQNFMSMLDQLDFEKKELDYKRKQKKDDDFPDEGESNPSAMMPVQKQRSRGSDKPNEGKKNVNEGQHGLKGNRKFNKRFDGDQGPNFYPRQQHRDSHYSGYGG
jgi:hypothetical protein